MSFPFRIGQGFDVHAFVEGRPLVIGGVTIPHTHGLAGHSDADVLTHAVCDALLGAAAVGDIGVHFPDTEPAYKDANSLDLLRRVGEMIGERAFKIVNIDATVIAQMPKIMPHAATMRENLASALGIDEDRVSIKATTSEGLGFTGRGEGIAALAVALLGAEE